MKQLAIYPLYSPLPTPLIWDQGDEVAFMVQYLMLGFESDYKYCRKNVSFEFHDDWSSRKNIGAKKPTKTVFRKF
jgi:hypothetical protein